jgi:predicted kinase
MALPVLVLITGPACTGKTTLARRLSDDFALPFFHKDGFKERMYEVVGERVSYESLSREQSRELSRFSFACLEIVMQALLSKGISLIVEGNFDSALFSPRLAALRACHPFHSVQIVLKTEGNVLLQRFIDREGADRHPGHQGLKYLPELQASLLRGECEPLQLEGDLLTFDTTDFGNTDFSPVWDLLAQRLTCGSAD